MGLDGFVSKCNVLAMPGIITKFTNEEGLAEIFQILIDNVHEVFTYGEIIKHGIKYKDYNSTTEAYDYILANTLDFNVNL